MITTDAETVGPWVASKTGGSWCKGRGTAIGRLKDGKLIGGVLYEDFTGANVVCHIAGEEGWASKKFLYIIFHYPLIQIGCRRITAPVASNNTASINLMKKLGFELECKLEQANPDSDILIFRMFKDQCKFLSERYKNG